jgi:hypothetical protein
MGTAELSPLTENRLSSGKQYAGERRELTVVSSIKMGRFQVLTAAIMRLCIFWAVVPCSLAEPCGGFRAITLMMEVAGTSETSVNFYQTTGRINLEDRHMQH